MHPQQAKTKLPDLSVSSSQLELPPFYWCRTPFTHSSPLLCRQCTPSTVHSITCSHSAYRKWMQQRWHCLLCVKPISLLAIHIYSSADTTHFPENGRVSAAEPLVPLLFHDQNAISNVTVWPLPLNQRNAHFHLLQHRLSAGALFILLPKREMLPLALRPWLIKTCC